MKKLFNLFILLILTFSLCSCNSILKSKSETEKRIDQIEKRIDELITISLTQQKLLTDANIEINTYTKEELNQGKLKLINKLNDTVTDAKIAGISDEELLEELDSLVETINSTDFNVTVPNSERADRVLYYVEKYKNNELDYNKALSNINALYNIFYINYADIEYLLDSNRFLDKYVEDKSSANSVISTSKELEDIIEQIKPKVYYYSPDLCYWPYYYIKDTNIEIDILADKLMKLFDL